MNITHRLRSGLVLGLILAIAVPIPCMAQEGTGETFDDPQLPGWERSPDTYVLDGRLLINPNNFALRFVEIQNFTVSMELKFSGPGAFTIDYSFREDQAYTFILEDAAMLVNRRQTEDERVMVGPSAHTVPDSEWFDLQITVAQGSHSISINGNPILEFQDSDPLAPGSLLLHTHGERTLEVDNLSISISPGAEPGPGEVESEPGGPEAQATDTPAAESDQPTGLAAFIQQLQVSNTETLELQAFAINLLLAALFSFVLSRAYVYWGLSLANRRKFAANFMLITITTTFIILVVRSSVALSLGLVGALSIVRFRAAIKEPEELAYLFFAIGLGIGLGDNQRLLTTLALIAGLLLIGLMRLLRRADSDVNLHLTVSTSGVDSPSLDAIVEALKAHCTKLQLVRYEEADGASESVFRIEFKSLSRLTTAADALRGLSKAVEVSYLSDRGLS